MSEELYVDGLGLAPGVMETIVAIAAKEVEALPALARLRSRLAFPLRRKAGWPGYRCEHERRAGR